MKEKGEKGAIVREDDRMTHRGQKCFFSVCLPVCAVYILYVPTVCMCSVSSSCSVIAVSVATEALEPHGGQPCKEHKRPI